MFFGVFEPWIIHVGPKRQISKGLGPIPRIYDERFHLPNPVIKFLNGPLFGYWPTDYKGNRTE